MRKFDKFIDDFLDKSGINDFDKKDLKDEIRDHLMLLKLDYINKGYSESDAIRLSIKDFGKDNSIGKEVRKNLPSKNKAMILSKKDKVKCIIYMFLSYFLFIFLSETVFEISHKTILFNVLLGIIPSLVGFIYMNIKMISDKNKVYNLKIILLIYFIIEKLIMSCFALISGYILRGKLIVGIQVKSSYMFNNIYISSYIIFSVVIIITQTCLDKNKIIDIKSPYSSKSSSVIVGGISIILMISYYLFPNKWYFIHCLIEKIIHSDIEVVSKNLLFIFINNKIIIPNVGLMLFIYLVNKKVNGMISLRRY
ncbi:membrane protein [Clostridium novyi A str. 4552]|uniref:Membrane protein n=1 Tax=Clostridium novyi A str. 4552 TaxID=1444289 RepID=A0A0A0I5F2_CLONO|nr:permease prefix domain 1-containing protein [Clostridium novyi]KGM95818.1 membrane protein [Clostridium novyi A str. 4552]